MGKQKLLIITGAGASVEFGMPSVADVDDIFNNDNRFVLTNNTTTLYQWIRQQMSIGRQNQGNYEDALYLIEALAGCFQTVPEPNFIRNFLNPSVIPNIDDSVLNRTNEPLDSYTLTSLYGRLVDELLSEFRQRSNTWMGNKRCEFDQLSVFLHELKQIFDISYVTTNHDNILLTAMPDNITGFDSKGNFERSLLYNNTEWNYGIHLHGSVHFDMQGNQKHGYNMHEIRWQSNLNANFASNAAGRNGINTRTGNPLPHSTIIAGIDKTNQLLLQPFMSYYMLLDKLIWESDVVLFIGYGFQDDHLNRAFEFIRYDWTKIRKVVVIDYANNGTASLNGGRRDDWSKGLSQTIPYNSHDMGNGSHRRSVSMQIIDDFKSSNTLEKSSNSKFPLAIWYDGFMNACRNIGSIMTELH